MSAEGAHGQPPTLDQWIDSQEPPVPTAFRPHLAVGPRSSDKVSLGDKVSPSDRVSPAALLHAAEAALKSCAERNPRDRAAAFSLLAADAYVTFACLRVLQEGGNGEALRSVARQVGKIDVEWRE